MTLTIDHRIPPKRGGKVLGILFIENYGHVKAKF
jgi:hypothetical protein